MTTEAPPSSEADHYRAVSRFDLRRAFSSLGAAREDFKGAGPAPTRTFFDAVLNADASRPNGVFVFLGSDWFVYDLATGAISEPPKPIHPAWGAGGLPEQFKTGIHAAAYGGPAFPNLWTLFKDESYVVMDSRQGYKVTEGPRGVLGAWASGAWTDASGRFRTPGVPVALHGLGSDFDGMVHFFKDGQYIRHNLRTGQPDCALMPTGDAWSLPEPFLSHIDLAFYGTGTTEENIFFISGERYVLYDFRTRRVIDGGALEDRFPAFAQFIGRPQLFLVEDYSVETFVGPVSLGRLIDTRSIGAGSKITRILVTETTDTTKSTITQSLLESQDAGVVTNFYDNMDRNTASSDSSDRYKYQLNASAHGDASATTLWGGEVNAKLNVSGATDTLRSQLSEATFKSIRNQVDESKRATQQKTYNSESEIESTVKVLKKEIFEETNTSDRVRVYEFFEQLEPYITLLTLRNVRIGFSDGTGPPRVVELHDLPGLLSDVLVDPATAAQLAAYVRGELSRIADNQGSVGSLLADAASGTLAIRPNLTSTYAIPMPDGTTQTVSVRGYLKADESWIEPTYTITCVQV